MLSATRYPRPMRRILLVVTAIVTIAVGLGVHAAGWGAAGDVLYAVLMYLLAAIVLRRGAWILALAWCVGVEFFQLTGWPAAWGSPWTLVFGSGFAWGDLACYAVGVVLAAGIDRVLVERRVREDARESGAI